MLNRIVENTYAVLEVIAGFLFLSIFALNIGNIVMRYFGSNALIWLPDFSRFLFVWVIFIGASVLVGRNEHLVMDYFITRLKPTSLRSFRIVIQFSQIAFFSIMLVGGLLITPVRMRIPFDTWDFPIGWAYIAVPVCALLMIMFSANNILQTLTTKNEVAK